MQIRVHIRKLNCWWSPVSKATVVAVLLLMSAGGIQAQMTFGSVLDINGEWVLNGNVKLSKGSKVGAGGVITAINPSSSGYIIIADRSGGIFAKRNCSNAGECNTPIGLPSSRGGGETMVTKFWKGAIHMLWPDPRRYATNSSRSAGADLQEALVRLDDQRLDLSQVFKNAASDRYLVRFEKLGQNQKRNGKPIKPFPFEWNSKKPAPLLATGLRPGLYRVIIQDVSLLEPEAGDAWVLVTAPKDYSKAARAFDTVKKVTEGWGTDVRQSTVRQYLRATLEFITTQSKH